MPTGSSSHSTEKWSYLSPQERALSSHSRQQTLAPFPAPGRHEKSAELAAASRNTLVSRVCRPTPPGLAQRSVVATLKSSEFSFVSEGRGHSSPQRPCLQLLRVRSPCPWCQGHLTSPLAPILGGTWPGPGSIRSSDLYLV